MCSRKENMTRKRRWLLKSERILTLLRNCYLCSIRKGSYGKSKSCIEHIARSVSYQKHITWYMIVASREDLLLARGLALVFERVCVCLCIGARTTREMMMARRQRRRRRRSATTNWKMSEFRAIIALFAPRLSDVYVPFWRTRWGWWTLDSVKGGCSGKRTLKEPPTADDNVNASDTMTKKD